MYETAPRKAATMDRSATIRGACATCGADRHSRTRSNPPRQPSPKTIFLAQEPAASLFNLGEQKVTPRARPLRTAKTAF
jgi:hypothetical protein